MTCVVRTSSYIGESGRGGGDLLIILNINNLFNFLIDLGLLNK